MITGTPLRVSPSLAAPCRSLRLTGAWECGPSLRLTRCRARAAATANQTHNANGSVTLVATAWLTSPNPAAEAGMLTVASAHNANWTASVPVTFDNYNAVNETTASVQVRAACPGAETRRLRCPLMQPGALQGQTGAASASALTLPLARSMCTRGAGGMQMPPGPRLLWTGAGVPTRGRRPRRWCSRTAPLACGGRWATGRSSCTTSRSRTRPPTARPTAPRRARWACARLSSCARACPTRSARARAGRPCSSASTACPSTPRARPLALPRRRAHMDTWVAGGACAAAAQEPSSRPALRRHKHRLC